MIEWETFKGTKWKNDLDVNDFIINNYQEYLEDETFLKGVSVKTTKLWNKCKKAFQKEEISGILDVETFTMSGIDNFEVGYVDKSNEVILGLQTDKPLKRIINPYLGYQMVDRALETYGYHIEKEETEKFKEYRKTSNEAILDIYTDEIKCAASNNLLVGLPDYYGRGNILGDYRRLALYGTDYIIDKKLQDLSKIKEFNEVSIEAKEKIREQINALNKLKKMASRYGFDVSKPASNAKEAIEWTYLAYLATVKQNSSSTNPIGRNTTFFDIYIEKDIKEGKLTEEEAQELIDQYVIKLRLVKQLRSPKFNEHYSGDPTFITECIGGMLDEEKSLITKTSYRIINTLNNIGEFAEPNLTILWSKNLPESFKNYVVNLQMKTKSIQFANDSLLRPIYGNDYAITSMGTPIVIGKSTEFNGASINFAKVLLYAINGGKDEITKEIVIDGIDELQGEYLNIDDVLVQFEKVLKKSIKMYVDSLNIIHYVDDKYSYESSNMAFIDTNPNYQMTFGVTGFSTVIDSISAIQYGHVRVKRNENGLTESFDIEFDYPRYGNKDERIDVVAKNLVKKLNREFSKYELYKNATPMISLSSATFNTIYGKYTGTTPDGRKEKTPFAFGANPVSGQDKIDVISSMTSVAKLPYKDGALAGIPYTVFIEPSAFKDNNLTKIIDTYMQLGGEFLNINVIDKKVLENVENNPSRYPNTVVGLSGYLVDFSKLNNETQKEVLNMNFFKEI